MSRVSGLGSVVVWSLQVGFEVFATGCAQTESCSKVCLGSIIGRVQGLGFRVVFRRFLKFTVPAMGGLPGGERPYGFGVLEF